MPIPELIEAAVRLGGAAAAEYVLHPLGVVILRVVTLGRYPPKNKAYNHQLVAMVPLVLALAVVTLVFS